MVFGNRLSAVLAAPVLSLALWAGTSHAAEMMCSFKSECLGVEACEETTFSMSFGAAEDAQPVPSDLVTDSSNTKGTSQVSEEGGVTSFQALESNGNAHLVTVAEDGTARYSLHLPSSELALYYQGTCSVGT